MLSDMIVRPRIRVIDDRHKYVLTQGYVLSEAPCNVCLHETDDPRIRRLDWTFDCPRCGNHVIYADISDWVRVFGRNGRELDQVNDLKVMNMHYKTRPRWPVFANWSAAWSEEDPS